MGNALLGGSLPGPNGGHGCGCGCDRAHSRPCDHKGVGMGENGRGVYMELC